MLVVEARNNGQDKIPIHIFPCRLDNEGIRSLEMEYASDETLITGRTLKPCFDDFEEGKIVNQIAVDKKGQYLTR